MDKVVKSIVDECVLASEYTDQVLEEIFDNDEFERCAKKTGISTLVSRLPIVQRIPEFEILALAKRVDRSLTAPSILHQNKGEKPLNFMFLTRPYHEDLNIPQDFARESNHVHISPKILLQDETNTGSELGRWIKTNQRSSKCITPGVYHKLLANKLDTLEVKKKGYVLSGFPILPGREWAEDCQPLSASQVQFFHALTSTVIETATEHDCQETKATIHEPPDTLHERSNTVSGQVNLQANNSSTCQLPQSGYDCIDTINLRWPTTENGLRRCIKNQFDFILQLSTQPNIIFHSDLQQCCDKSDAVACDDDNLGWFDMVQRFVLHFPAENVMTVGGVMPFEHWRFAVEPRLLQSVSFAGLEELCAENLVHPGFQWRMSDFGELCPVAMKEGRLLQGSSDFPVNYKGSVYMLSSREACSKFLASPEDYVRLKPTCRVAIVGSKSTGKSTLAHLLAHLLGGVVIPTALKFETILSSVRKITNGRWIIDGMPNDNNFWDLLSKNDLTPDVVMVLQDTSVSNWRSHSAKFREQDHVLRHFYQYFGEMIEKSVIDAKKSPSTETLKEEIALCTIKEVIQQVCEFSNIDDEYDSLKQYCKEQGIELLDINVSAGTWSEVLIGAISQYLNIFQCPPREVGAPTFNCVTFGSFADFCPLALNDRQVLQKGQRTLHVIFKNKSYFMSNEGAMQRFIGHPQLFVTPVGLPAPRISITGPPGTGKTTITRRLSEKYGVPIVERKDLLQTGIEKFFKTTEGFIMDGYPETDEELAQMVKTSFVPELCVNLRENLAPTVSWADHDVRTMSVMFDVSVDVTWKRVEKSIERYMKRDQLFQTTIKLELATANTLIDVGMFPASRFGRQCPVQNYEKAQRSVCNFSSDAETQAVLFLEEIYFLKGQQRAHKFCENPAKYTEAANQVIPQIQHRVVLIGPPNSGKTTLSRRCAERFGITLVDNADLNGRFEDLYKFSGGWVLDNPKLTDKMLQTLCECGQEPTAIVVITEDGRCEDLKELKSLRFKNVKYLQFSQAKWKMWHEVQKFMLNTELGIFEYGQNMNAERPALLEHLNVSQQELNEKMSFFRNFCPQCYVDDDKLVCYEHTKGCGGPTILSGHDFHSNLVQWREVIFWTCNQHRIEVLNMSSMPQKRLPKELPMLVNTQQMEFKARRDYCVVTASKNGRERVKGLEQYAVLYQKKIFLMANERAALEFLEAPKTFANFRLKPVIDPKLRCGLDENAQNLLSKSLKECCDLRPKHRDMTVEESAAVFVGFYLKAHNPTNSSFEKEYYQTVFHRFLTRTLVRTKRCRIEPPEQTVCVVNHILNRAIATAVQPERYQINKFLEQAIDRTVLASSVRQILSELVAKIGE